MTTKPKKEEAVNYILHLNGWLAKISEDSRMNTTHVSLYLTLFHLWNLSRFKNPFYITRMEVMNISKIGSKTTYSKCLKDLDQWEYIQYHPSNNPRVGSEVYMSNMGTSEWTSPVPKVGRDMSNNGTTHLYSTNSKHKNSDVNQNKDFGEPL